jgi:hypothetical protein
VVVKCCILVLAHGHDSDAYEIKISF